MSFFIERPRYEPRIVGPATQETYQISRQSILYPKGYQIGRGGIHRENSREIEASFSEVDDRQPNRKDIEQELWSLPWNR